MELAVAAVVTDQASSRNPSATDSRVFCSSSTTSTRGGKGERVARVLKGKIRRGKPARKNSCARRSCASRLWVVDSHEGIAAGVARVKVGMWARFPASVVTEGRGAGGLRERFGRPVSVKVTADGAEIDRTFPVSAEVAKPVS